MRAAVWMALLAGVCAAQERPVAGYFCDGAGALRVLEGVEGAWVARIAVAEGVLSAGYDGRALWYKTERALHVRNGDGPWLSLEAPGGKAEARRSRDGQIERFVFPEAKLAAGWHGEKLGDLVEWDGDEEAAEEWLDAEWRLARKESGLYAWRAGLEPVLVPMAEAVTFQLFVRNGTQETAVGSSFVMPPAAPG
ncbi:MAG: hypothetical protein HY821_22800, partial [Acidobacteria bacterium]|nr:hypothetical protein [Acidobacteriota bacterium]